METSKRVQKILESQEWEEDQKREYARKCWVCNANELDIPVFLYAGMNMCEDCIVDEIENCYDDLTEADFSELSKIDSIRVQTALTKARTHPIIEDFFETLAKIIKPQ